MNNLVDLRSIVFGLLISINCHATDSRDISKLAFNSSRLVPAPQEVVANTNVPCVAAPTAVEAYYLRGSSGYQATTCPSDFPLAKSVNSSITTYLGTGTIKTYLLCCKTRVQYS